MRAERASGRAGGRAAEERDVDEGARNSGERNRTIMMRFIESIVSPGSGVRRHNRCVSIAGIPRRGREKGERERERRGRRGRENGAIQSTFNFWMVLRSCESRGPRLPACKAGVSSLRPAVSKDTLDVLYLSIWSGSMAAIFASSFWSALLSFALSLFLLFFFCSSYSPFRLSFLPSAYLTLINLPVVFLFFTLLPWSSPRRYSLITFEEHGLFYCYIYYIG